MASLIVDLKSILFEIKMISLIVVLKNIGENDFYNKNKLPQSDYFRDQASFLEDLLKSCKTIMNDDP